MKILTKNIITDFNTKDFDWFGYSVSSKHPYTYHHIVKKEHGGLYVYDNGAILCGGTGGSHEELHIIEYKDPELYVYLNNLLKVINDQRYKPTLRQLRAVKAILEQFEREHCSDRTSKGKQLIKEEYIKNRIKL